MTPGGESAVKFAFDEFELDVRGGELRKNGTPVKLQDQPLKVLVLLVARAGQVVTRQEIRQHIWGGDTFVDYEQGINYCIRQIRAALSEDAAEPRYIGTCPRRGYRFLAPVSEIQPCHVAGERKIMLAVLPLENLSTRPDSDYFADGLTDDLISGLGGLSSQQLGVIARTSSMKYKRTRKDVGQIGRELRVSYIVEGAVRRAGKRVRITVQLIRVSDQTHIWAHSYERHLEDVFLLQSELASAIAAEVQSQLVPRPVPASSPRRRVDPEAYENCLRARYCWNRRNRDDLYRALELFSNAIQRDPTCAPAFAGLADTYLALLDYRYVAPKEALAIGTAAAVNALTLDDHLAEAHTSLAHAKMHALDWPGAEQEFRRAIQLGPGYSVARFYYANFLVARRRFDEAIDEAREAVRLDPVSMVAESNIAILYYNAGRYDEALKACKRALHMEPGLARPYDDLGRILFEQGERAEAIEALEKAVSLSNRSARCLSSLGYAYGAVGRKELALAILAELTEKSRHSYIGSSDFAFVHAGLGERDQTFQWLERAYEERDSHVPFVHVDPRLTIMRADPRFQALLKRLGL